MAATHEARVKFCQPALTGYSVSQLLDPLIENPRVLFMHRKSADYEVTRVSRTGFIQVEKVHVGVQQGGGGRFPLAASKSARSARPPARQSLPFQDAMSRFYASPSTGRAFLTST